MQTVYLDFESYYDKEYSLSKMTTIEYVLDKRWKTLGCAVAIDDEPSKYLSDDEFKAWIQTVDWANSLLVAHNCLFDGTVLTQRYGVKPAKYACTATEARALLPIDSASLRAVSKALGIGEKGDALVEGASESTQALADYACNDNDLARRIHKMLYDFFPEVEKELMSLTIRMGVEPTIELDVPLLEKTLEDARQERQATIAASGVPEGVLSSNPQFAAHLRSLGIVVPQKISATTGEETDALGKGDAEFQALMAEYPDHAELFEARLAAKSTIGISRPEAFLRIARLPSALPIPLRYWGAHTGRWSGSDGINLQNLPQQRKSALRRTLRAPKGYVVVAADSSQIELRINLWFSKQTDRLEILRQGGDIYVADAADFFGLSATDVGKDQRQFGKVRQLGLGFGMGHRRFRYYCASGPLGMAPIHLTDNEAWRAVTSYRHSHPYVKASWDFLQEVIPAMTLPDCHTEHGCITFIHEGIVLPNGMTLSYPGLRATESGGWEWGVDKKTHYLYGSKLQENIVQALARIVVAEQMLEIDKNYRVVAMTHDENVFLAPADEAEQAERLAVEIMSTPPSWAPDLPVGAEVKSAEYYCK